MKSVGDLYTEIETGPRQPPPYWLIYWFYLRMALVILFIVLPMWAAGRIWARVTGRKTP